MLKETAEILERFGHDEVEARLRYKGKGMFGDIVGSVLVAEEKYFLGAVGAVLMHGSEQERRMVGDALQDIEIEEIALGITYS